MLKPFGKPIAVGLAAIEFDSIAQTVRPTAAQRAAFDQLKAISVEAEEMVRTVCPGTPPATNERKVRFDALRRAQDKGGSQCHNRD